MLVDTVKQLKQRKAAIRSEIAKLNAEDKKLDRAIAAISALPISGSAPVAKAQPAKKRKVSAATRAKMKRAQQARWAKIKGPKTAAVKPAKKKNKMSAAGKAKLSAMMKARWAAKKKAAKK